METRFSLGFHLASRSGEGSIEPQGFHAQLKPDVFCGESDEWNSVLYSGRQCVTKKGVSENGIQSIPVDYHHFLPILWP